MDTQPSPFILVALTILITTVGCIGGVDEALDRAGGVDDASDGNVELYIDATNVPDELVHVGFEIDQIFLHDADSDAGQGHFSLDLAAQRADVVTGDTAQETLTATGDLSEGDYDAILLQLNAAQVHGQAAMGGGGHDDHVQSEGDDQEGNDTDSADHADHAEHAGHGDENAQGPLKDVAFEPGAFELTLPVTFDLVDDEVTEIRLVLDVEASVTKASYKPTFDVEITRGDETITEETVTVGLQVAPSGHVFDTQPPAARVTVFAPDGDRVHEPAFDAQDGVFANQMSTAFHVGEEARFTATASEALEEGAAIEEERWDLGDGSTATGTAVTHAYDSPGVYEVTLTLVDSLGAVDTHTVRVVVASWTDTVVDTHFEDGAGEWSANTTGQATIWELSGEGYESGPSWHAAAHGAPIGYEPETTTVLASPTYEIPDDWLQAGFSVQVMGDVDEVALECVPSSLEIAYTVGEETEIVDTFTSEPDWIQVGSQDALDAFIGEEITFTFTFETSCNVPDGEGWFMDAFQLGGLPQEDFANAHLLEGVAQGDGHAHQH